MDTMKKPNISKKNRVVFLILALIGLAVGLCIVTISINSWFEKNRLVFHAPVEVAFYQPVRVEERKPEIQQIILDYPDEIDTPIEKYICEKWGPYDCKTALAVFKAESGLNEEAYHVNTNNTVDVGIAQVNSIHFKKPGCSLKELVDQYKNVDCAYTIWKSSGWGAWVGFNNGNFKTHL